MADATWIATLSDGSTVAEHSGQFKIVPGERTPWFKLCQHLQDNSLQITSLRLNFDGRVIHMPRLNFDRFSYNEVNHRPSSYSLRYHIEGDLDFGSGKIDEERFVDLCAHYEDWNMAVHFIQSIDQPNNSWVLVTKDEEEALASAPAKTGE